MAKALITGIDGFAAPYLAEELLKKGYSIIGSYLVSPGRIVKGVDYEKLDILNKDDVKKLVSDFKPEYVFHLAGFSSVAKSWENPELCRKINVEGTRNLLDALVEENIKAKLLFISSAEVYGKPKFFPITEEHPLNPENPYAESKLEAEGICLLPKYKSLSIVISRSFNHTGTGQSPDFVCSDFAKQIAEIEKGKREPVIKVGNLEAKRDFSDVRDISIAYSLFDKCKPGIYNIGSGRAYAIREILDILISMSRAKIKEESDPKKFRKIDVPVMFGSHEKFSAETGWQPRISIEKTLESILDYWREKI
ncbi:MAG: GDP-mannose 4,6-dehydratase [Candidatus Woesearchaeota archaeon]|nr:GDP-mannose 4,6-dehydratase [Candidatus Woesearchaeota archaeon]